MSILEILFEKYLHKKQKEKYHPDGTYISAELCSGDCDVLFDFAKSLKIPNLSAKEEYHATINYSRKGVPQAKEHEFTIPMTAKIVGWKIFDTQTGGKCLVAALESKDLTKTHKSIIDKYGATHGFPSYQPHVTVSYDYGSDVAPKDYPRMTLTFDRVRIEPLDPEFKPKKAS